MNIIITPISLFLLLIVVSERASAYQSEELPLDLYTLYTKAVVHDPEINAAKFERKAASEALTQGQSGLLPQLSVSAEHERYERRTGAIRGLTSEQNDHYTRQVVSASLTQPVFNLEAWYRFRAGQSLRSEASTEYAKAMQSLGERLITAYFRALRSQSNLAARQAEKEALSRQKTQIEKQLQAGITSRIDLLDVVAEESRVTVELVKAQREQRRALKDLEAMTGASIRQVVPLGHLPEQYSLGTSTALMATAQAGNPRLLSARHEVITARYNAAAADSAHAPTLSLEMFAQRDLSDSPDVVPPGTGRLTTDTTGIALRLELPIYSGGRTSSHSRESRYLLNQAKENLRLVRTSILNELESAYDALQSTRQAVNASTQAVDARKVALEAAEKGQKAGIRDLVDVLRARREQFRALDVLNDVRYEYVTILARIYRLAGELDAKRIRRINQWLAPL